MSKPKYFFDTFSDLKPFDILSNQEVVDRYTNVENLFLELNSNKKFDNTDIHISKNKGKTGPVYSDRFNSKQEYHDSIHKPITFMIKPSEVTSEIEVQAVKSDITTMDLYNIGKEWDHWVYLTIPKEFIVDKQKCTHSNHSPRLISIFKEYIKEIVDNNLTDKEAYKLQLEYDKKYPELYHLPTKRLLRPGWRHDNKVSQVLSVRKSGIFFPIAYPNHLHGGILKRGTHRALVFAALGYDVPIIIQHPELGGNPEAVFELTTANDGKIPYFSDIEYKFRVDLKNKKLSYE